MEVQPRYCPKCKVRMKIGTTLYPYEEEGVLYVTGRPPQAVMIIQCYKCPACGHSEDEDETK